MGFEQLKKSSQFSDVYKKGQSTATRFVVMYYMPNKLGYNRVGYSVSKKVGKSVVRNRAKRLMKEVFRLNVDRLKEGYDFVFIARVRMNEATYSDVEKSMRRLFKEIK